MKNTYLAIGTMSMMLTLTGCFEAKLDPGALGTGTGGSAATDRGVLDPTVTWLGAGNYTDVDLAALPASKVCSDKSIFGTTGTAVCASAPSALDVTAAFVSGNYSSIASAPAANTYRSSVTLFGTVGTMAEPASHASTNSTSNSTTVTLTPQLGYWDGSRTVSITDAALVSSNIKAGATIFGVAGSSSVVETSSGDAVAGEVVSGKKAYVNGALVTGTATSHGALNLNTTAIPGTSAGFYASIALTISASSVCAGTSIFGAAGTAICNSVFGDLTASNMHRDRTTTQMTLTTEKTTLSYASGYRVVPDITKDDDGFDGGSPVVKAVRPGVGCGQSNATVEARIADCLAKNGASATWSGATKGITGEATWKLVTNSPEVWRDERTGLLWGDSSVTASWCRASGNAQTVGDGICDPADTNGYGGQDATPTSVCAEEGSLLPAIGGENWTTGVYDGSKGGMGLIASGTSPSVRWRLPTKYDWQTADNDGIRFVLPNMNNMFWSATVVSNGRDNAWNFDGSYGNLISNDSYASVYVRCVGR